MPLSPQPGDTEVRHPSARLVPTTDRPFLSAHYPPGPVVNACFQLNQQQPLTPPNSTRTHPNRVCLCSSLFHINACLSTTVEVHVRKAWLDDRDLFKNKVSHSEATSTRVYIPGRRGRKQDTFEECQSQDSPTALKHLYVTIY